MSKSAYCLWVGAQAACLREAAGSGARRLTLARLRLYFEQVLLQFLFMLMGILYRYQHLCHSASMARPTQSLLTDFVPPVTSLFDHL